MGHGVRDVVVVVAVALGTLATAAPARAETRFAFVDEAGKSISVGTRQQFGQPVTLGPPRSLGLAAAESVIGIDFDPRPGREVLYAVTKEGTTGRLYTIDIRPTSSVIRARVGTGTVALGFGNAFGVEVDPRKPADLQIASDANDHIVVDTTDGTLRRTEGAVAYVSGTPTDPDLSGLAFTPEDSGVFDAFALDHDGDRVAEGDYFVDNSDLDVLDFTGFSGVPFDHASSLDFDPNPEDPSLYAAVVAPAPGVGTKLHFVNESSGAFQTSAASTVSTVGAFPHVSVVPAGGVSLPTRTVYVREGTAVEVEVTRSHGYGNVPVTFSCEQPVPDVIDIDCPPPTTLDDGRLTGSIFVSASSDDVREGDETGFVRIGSVGNGGANRGGSVAVVVLDDEPAEVAVTGAVVAESAGSATVRIDRLGEPRTAQTVRWTATDGTAKAPGDYSAASGVASFAAGQRSVDVAIPITRDAVHEPDETFTVVLSESTAIAAGRGSATVTVLDDDPAPRPAVTGTGTPGTVSAPAPGPGPTPGADDAPPVVTFTAPAAGATIRRPGEVSMTASDDRGVARVVLVAGDRVVGEATTAPYSVLYTPPPVDVGRTTLTAIALDAAGQSATARRAVTVAPVQSTVTLRATPTRDRTAPFRYVLTGTVVPPPGERPATACARKTGVTLFVRGPGAPARRPTTTVGRTCRFRATVTLRGRAKGRPTVEARFAGTATLAPARSPRLALRAG